MALVKRILEQVFPDLQERLVAAKIKERAEPFLRKKLMSALYLSVGMAFLSFMFADKMEITMLLVPASFIVWFFLIFFVLMKTVDTSISKLKKEIDKDVLFAGRFLLVKLSSGKSLIASIEDASQSYGVASDYFKDIMKDIELGTPLEKALENATATCPSKMLSKILFQITNALEIGIDVHKIVESVLADIAAEQLQEIEAYGKKLSSVALFYMLFAVVMPSLGLALLIIIASLVSIDIDSGAFIVMAFFMIILEVLFMTIFKSIRPSVNL